MSIIDTVYQDRQNLLGMINFKEVLLWIKS